MEMKHTNLENIHESKMLQTLAKKNLVETRTVFWKGGCRVFPNEKNVATLEAT